MHDPFASIQLSAPALYLKLRSDGDMLNPRWDSAVEMLSALKFKPRYDGDVLLSTSQAD